MSGPLQGNGRRKMYSYVDGEADIYKLMVLALKADPPVTELQLSEIRIRLHELVGDGVNISSSTISATCNKIVKIVEKAIPELDALEYNQQCLYILDPFLLFFLRWRV